MSNSLADLENSGDFIRRHIGPDNEQVATMLEHLGLDDLEAIIDHAIPSTIVASDPFSPRDTISEQEVIADLKRMGRRNQIFVSMIGMGYYDTIMPEVIKRNVLENPGWYTAYTPYQAEISKGRLEALLNFQQTITDLTAMEIANASVLDEATAAAEAMAMARRLSKSDSNVFLVDAECHPQTIAVVQTRARSFGYELVVAEPGIALRESSPFGVLLQYPGSNGVVRDIEPEIACAQSSGAIVAVATDLLALCLLKPPGEMGADIVVGSAQRFGVPMGYGGPHAAFFATREKFVRAMPGAANARATYSARTGDEQHLHIASVTGSDCRVLCYLPWPGGA
jgi:glycine dehydrogenase